MGSRAEELVGVAVLPAPAGLDEAHCRGWGGGKVGGVCHGSQGQEPMTCVVAVHPLPGGLNHLQFVEGKGLGFPTDASPPAAWHLLTHSLRQPTHLPARSIPPPAWCGTRGAGAGHSGTAAQLGTSCARFRGPRGVEPGKGFWGGGTRWPPEVGGVSGCGRECGGDGEEGP